MYSNRTFLINGQEIGLKQHNVVVIAEVFSAFLCIAALPVTSRTVVSISYALCLCMPCFCTLYDAFHHFAPQGRIIIPSMNILVIGWRIFFHLCNIAILEVDILLTLLFMCVCVCVCIGMDAKFCPSDADLISFVRNDSIWYSRFPNTR